MEFEYLESMPCTCLDFWTKSNSRSKKGVLVIWVLRRKTWFLFFNNKKILCWNCTNSAHIFVVDCSICVENSYSKILFKFEFIFIHNNIASKISYLEASEIHIQEFWLYREEYRVDSSGLNLNLHFHLRIL